MAPYSCSVCGQRWHGLTAAHCATCHRTFGSAAAFDLHYGGDRCLVPDTVAGLLPVPRPGYTMWIIEQSGEALWGDFD